MQPGPPVPGPPSPDENPLGRLEAQVQEEGQEPVRDPLYKIMKGVAARAVELDKSLSEQFSYTALGFTKPGPKEMRAFAAMMLEMYPPEPFVTPSGEVVVASAWMLALHMPNVVNRKEWLDALQQAASEKNEND